MTQSLGGLFPVEQERARQLLVTYREIGPPGAFGAHMIEQALARAERAAAAGDVVEMIRSYQALRDLK